LFYNEPKIKVQLDPVLEISKFEVLGKDDALKGMYICIYKSFLIYTFVKNDLDSNNS